MTLNEAIHSDATQTETVICLFFLITGLLFRKSQWTLNICHDIRNTFPVSDPTIVVSSENNSLFPLNGRTQAPWGGSTLSLSRSCLWRELLWAMASCVSVWCSELHLSELSSTHLCMFSSLSKHTPAWSTSVFVLNNGCSASIPPLQWTTSIKTKKCRLLCEMTK